MNPLTDLPDSLKFTLCTFYFKLFFEDKNLITHNLL